MAGRPPLPIGTAGAMRINEVSPGVFRARCRFRDWDGVTRGILRTGSTKNKARNNLLEAIRDRSYAEASAQITPDTPVSQLAELWYAEMKELNRSPNTLRQYRDRLDNQVLPALGALRIREATTSRCDRLLKSVKENNGAATAKVVRTVLSGLFGLAARHDALDQNPVREAGRIAAPKKAARSLSLDQARDLRARIAADLVAIRRDLPDFTDLMLATGMRIGEAAAIVRDAVDLDAGTVEIRGTVVRVKGVGLYIKPEPKTDAGYRTLELPSWMVEVLRRRAERLGGEEPMFPAPAGGLRDPSNTSQDLREAFDGAGYSWVTSHVYRRTVASLMDEAGLSARAAADQLGHVRVSMTQDNYFGRKARATGGAQVMEAVVEAS